MIYVQYNPTTVEENQAQKKELQRRMSLYDNMVGNIIDLEENPFGQLQEGSYGRDIDEDYKYDFPSLYINDQQDTTNTKPSNNTQDTSSTELNNSSFTSRFLNSAKEWLGVKYVWGGRSKKGVDCSNFVSLAAENAGLKLTGNVSHQWNTFAKDSRIFYDASQLQPGDLVFFKGTQKKLSANTPSHVAIYMGDGKIIHASSSKGVTIANLGDNYYQKHLKGYGKMYNS